MGLRILKGPKPGSLRAMKKRMRDLGAQASGEVARRGSVELTQRTQASFDSGRNVYGDARPQGKHGDELTLVHTGATRASLRFVSQGTIMRAALGTRYAKYLIGKYKILPIGDRTAMPVAWARALDRIIKEVMDSKWGEGKAA